jgi:tetrathionate reductase subunit B
LQTLWNKEKLLSINPGRSQRGFPPVPAMTRGRAGAGHFSGRSNKIRYVQVKPVPMTHSSTRREFLETGLTVAAGAGIGAAGRAGPDRQEQTRSPADDDLASRLTPPDDGKRFGWFIDTRRCFGCHGCEVACKSENDIPLGNYIRQTFYKDVGDYPKVARLFLPMSCQHCEDAPCIKACPSSAIAKGVGGSVIIDYTKCSGEGECVNACPYGAIYIDKVHKQAVKCHNCYHRLEHDMQPACASTCPSDAIYFGDLNDPESKVSQAMKKMIDGGLPVVQLRTEKNTQPRMWFAGEAPVEIEPRLPREGESYTPDAYNIYNWKESPANEQ